MPTTPFSENDDNQDMMMYLGRTTPITKNYLDTEYVDREVSLGERKRDMHVT